MILIHGGGIFGVVDETTEDVIMRTIDVGNNRVYANSIKDAWIINSAAVVMVFTISY